MIMNPKKARAFKTNLGNYYRNRGDDVKDIL